MGRNPFSVEFPYRISAKRQENAAVSSRNDQSQLTLVSPTLVKVLTSRWRAKIWSELSKRPMSPSQFVREFGGERSHIARRFRELAEWELIELVETRRGGRRRGGVEHVYRTVQRARIDNETASRLPLPMREEISANVLTDYVGRIAEAVEAGTFDAEVDRHLSYDAVALDRQAWTELTDELDRAIDSVPTIVVAAAQRMASSGEEPIPATIGMAAFRSPRSPGLDEPLGAVPPPPAGGEEGAWDQELQEVAPFLSAAIAKAVANPWRTKILAEVSLRPMSPSQFVREVGGELEQVSRCFRQLATWGFLELVEKRPARGRGPVAVEHVYGVARRIHLPTESWREVSRMAGDDVSAGTLANYLDRISTAFEAGTFDLEPDRHLSWDMPVVDREGWGELTSLFGRARQRVAVLEGEVKERGASAEELILVTVGLAAFRSPPASG
jgi:hypothetical protein